MARTLAIAAAAAMLFFTSAVNAAITFSVSATSTITRGSSLELTVLASGSDPNPVSVKYATQDGTAKAGIGYTAVSGTLLFFPGAGNPTTAKILVPILSNTNVPGSTMFTVALTNATVITPNGAPGASIADASTTVTIPELPGQSAFFASPANISAIKSQGTALITVTKSGAATNTITIDYATANGTAVAGTDFAATTGTLRFAFDETTKVISVPLIGTNVPAAGAQFSVLLSNPISLAGTPDNVIITNAATQVTILSTETSPSLYLAAVAPSTQANARSYLRIYNSADYAAPALVTLYDGGTGALLAKWTSPSIPAGSEQQFDIGTIEINADRGFTKPASYSVAVQATFAGSVQHVVYRTAESLLTNQTACASGIAASPSTLIAVHTKNLSGFLSSIILNNPSAAPVSATLGFYNAQTGVKLGTFLTAPIAAKGQVIQPVDAIENAGSIVPPAGVSHYVVKIESTYPGFLQHLVTNRASNVTTDMTVTCPFPAL